MRTDLILPHVDLRPSVRLRLVTFAHAGGGVTPFLPWQSSLPPGITLCPSCRPGREARFHEAPLKTVHLIAKEAAHALLTLPSRPTVLFGHSLGALVAFEVARILEARDAEPLLLVVAAKPAPMTVSTRPRIAGLPSAELIVEVERRYGVMEGQGAQSRELLELVLPALRADLEASESYAMAPGPKLRCPVWACHGEADPSMGAAAATGWAEVSQRSLETTGFSGGHLFAFEPASGFVGALSARLAQLIR